MLDRIQRGSFGREQGARLPLDTHQHGARRGPRTLFRQDLDGDGRIERAEEGLRDRQTRDDDVLARRHRTGETGIRRDHGFGGDIAAFAQILRQRRRDEGGEVEPVDREGHQSPVTLAGPRSPCPTVPDAMASIASRLFFALRRRSSAISIRGSRSRSAT